MRIRAFRYHDFSCGHRVVGHESKCADFHGHNYRITFHCESANLDEIGRVIDFSVIKAVLCQWLEDNWDHRFLVWSSDPYWPQVKRLPGFIEVPFNPTAENMGYYLLRRVGPSLLPEYGVTLVKVVVEETRKCSAEVTLD